MAATKTFTGSTATVGARDRYVRVMLSTDGTADACIAAYWESNTARRDEVWNRLTVGGDVLLDAVRSQPHLHPRVWLDAGEWFEVHA